MRPTGPSPGAKADGLAGYLCYTHRHRWHHLSRRVFPGLFSVENRGHQEVVMYQALESRTNQFRGVEVTPDALPEDPLEFRRRLDDSLRAWGSEGLLAVWLRVPIDRSALIPVAVEAGFTFHHSGDDYLMLTHRLVEDATIPPFATHFIGAGGVVINDEQELLVVRERYGFGGRPPALKLPGGALLRKQIDEHSKTHGTLESCRFGGAAVRRMQPRRP